MGAASAALDVPKLPTSTKSSPAPSADFSAKSSEPFDGFNSTALTASATPTSITPEMMAVLQAVAAQDQSKAGSANPAPTRKSDALNDLFSQLDADSDAQISKSEFETALGAAGTDTAEADKVFGKMDKDADGSVSSDEMCAALLKGSHRNGQHYFPVSHRDRSGAPKDANVPASNPHAVSSSSVANSDGTTTTSLFYTDGSKATMRSAATSSGEATSSYNFIEQMILRQAKALASGTTASLSVSA
ncbi:MAG: EF-hand domain-containing protein [Novosphingobium sp.]|nr:EF-hand domain-containing protein [Novosphingobium sp.]